jgi:hypothetical protein
MKKTIYLLLSLFLLGTAAGACSPKVGCPVTESARPKTNRKGELSSKRGKSQLFPKNMRRG